MDFIYDITLRENRKNGDTVVIQVQARTLRLAKKAAIVQAELQGLYNPVCVDYKESVYNDRS